MKKILLIMSLILSASIYAQPEVTTDDNSVTISIGESGEQMQEDSQMADDSEMMNDDGMMNDSANSQENRTQLDGGRASAGEIYQLSLVAPEIDNYTFPVPVLYFDDLSSGSARLKATLNVPLRLDIENSRKRRLLTVISLDGDQEIPYGTPLRNLKQIQLSSYKDVNTGETVLTEFVGPNKRIFRAISDSETYTIDFILPINHTHFHRGYVKVAVASSNGVELSQLCEFEIECSNTVVFRLVPREVIFKTNVENIVSEYRTHVPVQKLQVVESNVDLELSVNNVEVTTIDRKQLPFDYEAEFIIPGRPFNPHIASSSAGKTLVVNLDMAPIFHYMSNDNYSLGEVIVETEAYRGPDLKTRYSSQGNPIVDEVRALDNVPPFN